MSKKLSPLRLLPAITLLFLVAAGCSRSSPSKPIVVAVDASPWASPVYVAAAQGYFASEGLNVKLVQFSAGKLALTSLLGHQAQFATVSSVPIMFAVMNGQNLSITATFMKSTTSMKVIARKDRGITKPEELKGRRVATLIGTAGDFFMDQFLNAHGLTRADVQIINLQMPDAVTALSRGDIDAFFGWEPYIQNAKDILGNNGEVFVDPQLYTFTFNSVTLPDYAANHPETIRHFLTALLRAEDYMRANPERSISIVAQQIGMRQPDLEAVWQDLTFTLVLDNTITGDLQLESEWARKSGNLPSAARVPDFNQFLLPGPLREVNKGRLNRN